MPASIREHKSKKNETVPLRTLKTMRSTRECSEKAYIRIKSD